MAIRSTIRPSALYAVALRDKLAAMCEEQRDRIVENLRQHERGNDWSLIRTYLRDDIARWIVWWQGHHKNKKVRRRGDSKMVIDELRTLRGARYDGSLIAEFVENHYESYRDKLEETKAIRSEERAEKQRLHEEAEQQRAKQQQRRAAV